MVWQVLHTHYQITLTGNENGQLFIEAVYKDQKRENRYTIVNKTITLTKYTPTIIVGTNTNNSTTILTAIILAFKINDTQKLKMD